MKVTYINHASLLLESDNSFILTDPWISTPAFGSWLPTFPPAIDPVALLSLGSRLTVVLSHFHGDHFDPAFLSCLDSTTRICIPRFNSRVMIQRLQRMGFENTVELTHGSETSISSWNLLSVVSRKSDVDATIVIRTRDCAVIHGNDNWELWHDEDLELIRTSLADIKRSGIMNCSQANSASGYPLNYETFDADQQRELLRQKVFRMCISGIQNSRNLGLSNWYPYAGYASVFVKNHEEYLTRSIFPVPDELRNLLKAYETNPKFAKIEIADFLPGDTVDLKTGAVIPGFIRRTRLDLNRYRQASSAFLRSINAVNRCETYIDNNRPLTSHKLALNQLNDLLNDIGSAATLLIGEKQELASSLAWKQLGIEIRDLNLYGEINFGTMSISHSVGDSEPTETLVITSEILDLVCDGSMRANHLYIGYQGVWRRNPPHQFNSDIRQALATYTYRIQPRKTE